MTQSLSLGQVGFAPLELLCHLFLLCDIQAGTHKPSHTSIFEDGSTEILDHANLAIRTDNPILLSDLSVLFAPLSHRLRATLAVFRMPASDHVVIWRVSLCGIVAEYPKHLRRPVFTDSWGPI